MLHYALPEMSDIDDDLYPVHGDNKLYPVHGDNKFYSTLAVKTGHVLKNKQL